MSANLPPLFGKDVLVLRQFIGTEGLGELFEFEVDALSGPENVDFNSALGKSCTVKFNAYKGKDLVRRHPDPRAMD